mgnify:CR=1 FL=1
MNKLEKSIKILNNQNWQIHFQWIKGHVGIYGNKIADKFDKEATVGNDLAIVYQKIPKSSIIEAERRKSIEKWQQIWTSSTNGALTKSFFPSVKDRLMIQIPMTNTTRNFTTMVTGHGPLRSYYYRFRIL